MGYVYDAFAIGRNLASVRMSKMLTQEAVAKDIGISQSHYSKIELGKIHITVQLLSEFANYYNIDVEHLLGLKGVELTDRELQELKIYKETIIKKRN